jgi:hypothetical protein
MLYTFVLCSIDIFWTRRTTSTWSCFKITSFLLLLQENPFFYCLLLDQGLVHLLVSKISTGGITDHVGRDAMYVIRLCPILHKCIMDKRNHFYLVLLQENPFFFCLEQIWVHLLFNEISAGESTDVGR